MKILYVAPEHVSGTLSLFKREHERRGDICRYVTFWHSRWDFPDDICLSLSGMPNRKWIRTIRNLLGSDPHVVPSRVKNGCPPIWQPNPVVRSLFAIRDERNWRKIWRAIVEHGFLNYDIIHLDGGMDFTRDARFARFMKARGKGIVCYYHGSDLRARGLVPEVDALSDLNLTPEWDLVALDSRLTYLYLPIDVQQFEPRIPRFKTQIRIGHAARNPLKGSDYVVSAIKQLQEKYDIELVFITNMSHHEALKVKRTCDIFVDQLTNQGGWGYGMSAVEALAMGIPVITNIPEEMHRFIGIHPFIQAEPDTLVSVIERCVNSPDWLREVSIEGRAWVEERHDVVNVVDCLYSCYRSKGWLPT